MRSLAGVAELADATDSKSVSPKGSVGSSPTFGIHHVPRGRGRRVARAIGWAMIALGLVTAVGGLVWLLR